MYVPATYNPANPTPLVFNLHGYTSNAFQQEVYSNMNAVADTAGFIVCYPEGINAQWNSGFQPPYYGGVDDVSFISVLIDSLAGGYNVDLARVYSCGMSNGGFMSYRLACELGDRITAIASVTGSMTTLQLNNCQASRAIPVLEIHGTDDTTVPYNTNTLSIDIDSLVNYWRVSNGCMAAPIYDTLPDLVSEGSTVTTQRYTGCQDNVEVLHYKITNGGHTWAGSGIQLPGENTNQDIVASVEIWKFFYRYSHPAPVATAISEANLISEMEIVPNPSNGNFEIRGLEAASTITIVDAQGKLVRKTQSESELLSIDLRDLPAGIYVVEAVKEGKLQSKRLVISK